MPPCIVRGHEYTGIGQYLMDVVKLFGVAVREPTNPHDKNAIRLYATLTDGYADVGGNFRFTAVGYIAKEQAAVVAERMDRANEKTALVRYSNNYSNVSAISVSV